MAEFPTNQPRRHLNQFKNRNVVSINIDIPKNVMGMVEMVTNVTNTISSMTSSFASVSQSLKDISGSFVSQSIQIGNLEATTRSIGSNKLFSNKEIPVGDIDGVNTTYTLSNEPILGSDHIYLNGVLIEDKDNDYSISGSLVTFSNPLLPGMKLRCTYYYQDSSPVKVFKDKELPSGSLDGRNTIFTLHCAPVDGSEHVYLNGVLQENGGDYNISSSVISFIDAPSSTMKLRCTYYYIL